MIISNFMNIMRIKLINYQKKRKRDDNKNPEEDNEKKETISEPNGYFNGSLFDKNRKVILRHINIIHS